MLEEKSAFDKQGFGLFSLTAQMTNSGVYLEARTISGPLSRSCLSVGLLFTFAHTKQVSGEQMLIAFETIVQSTARCKDFISLQYQPSVVLSSLGETRCDGGSGRKIVSRS